MYLVSVYFSGLTAKECRRDGACVHFTVMDHDLLTSNDFAGEAFLPLCDIPGVSGEAVSGFSALTPLCLTITHPRRSGGATTVDVYTF